MATAEGPAPTLPTPAGAGAEDRLLADLAREVAALVAASGA